MQGIAFSITKQIPGSLGRAGVLRTSHGDIETPAFTVAATKASVKAIDPNTLFSIGAQAVLANTYHLYLEPGESVVERAGGVGKFMNWRGPTITDSGGFQVFSLGSAYESGVSKFVREGSREKKNNHQKLARVSEDGVTFSSHIDGSKHEFTPERSIQIQHALGADIIFSFDECTSPNDSKEYLEESLDRTHRWAKRGLEEHNKLGGSQGLFGIVQGGAHKEFREKSAHFLNSLPFSGFGIGGSFTENDLEGPLEWINKILDAERPRHLLGVGSTPVEIFLAVEHGCDTFDCVTPTRVARNGTLYTKEGTVNILNARYKEDMTPLSEWCSFFEGSTYTRSYLAHLFRAKEMFAGTLATINNISFYIELMKDIRTSIHEDRFFEFKKEFLDVYGK